jgi:DNA repair/transcription protein MET18/MMS19
MRFADKLMEIFHDEAINWKAARSFGGILTTNEILTKENHAVIKILFAQKLVNNALPSIMEGAKTSSNHHQKVAFLVALTALIGTAPKTTYIHEMHSVSFLAICKQILTLSSSFHYFSVGSSLVTAIQERA